MKTNLIYPCLWFRSEAKEAAEFYSQVLENSYISAENQMVVILETAGLKIMFLNGRPELSFNPSISFYVLCNTENEIDLIYQALIKGGSELMPLDKYEWSSKYVWFQDKFGVNWQLSYGGMEKTSQKISPMLMFTGGNAGKASEAISFYSSVFGNISDNVDIARYSKGDKDTEGTVKHAEFRLGEQSFMAIDSSYMHQFTFNDSVSMVVECETQEEIDYFWDKLTRGGEEIQCGWLKDRFGVSWQIIPEILGGLMSDPLRAERVSKALLKMKKLDIEKLLNA